MEGNICLKARSKDTAHKAALILLSSPVTFFRLISENRVSQGNKKYMVMYKSKIWNARYHVPDVRYFPLSISIMNPDMYVW